MALKLVHGLPIALLCILSGMANAQITLDKNDFANAGDTALLSVSVWNPNIDYESTDTNFVWDFSSLNWQSQLVDEYLGIFSTSPIYGAYYSNLSFNPNRANIAKAGGNLSNGIALLAGVFTDVYSFYYKDSLSYKQKGFGISVAGFPTPVRLSAPDVLYHFPVQYGNNDTSYSTYHINVPQLGDYTHTQLRTNKVDGWGTLLSPYGSFDVLRVVSEMRGTDSLYIDSLQQEIKVSNPVQREYKWIGKGLNVPLLQINTQVISIGSLPGFEFVTRVVYLDSTRIFPSSIFDATQNKIQFRVYPNPSRGSIYVAVPEDLTSVKITVTDMNGQVMMEQHLSSSLQQIDTDSWARGIYFLTVQSNEGKSSRKLVLQ